MWVVEGDLGVLIYRFLVRIVNIFGTPLVLAWV